ncbi:hypothetical protein SJ05684_c20380 [Sinorhizobium sojae CCBAU 05684]|uniref:Uncharacterized protein n=1 Tax=Sinorhizobium sojae CCBAU 05684 TaxID=716928 RepID=A0A249PC03_9HYPH|nr:hypothetical protein SJ05684_c20380 [Sinorhizobium sojae CCBAU 05684]
MESTRAEPIFHQECRNSGQGNGQACDITDRFFYYISRGNTSCDV